MNKLAPLALTLLLPWLSGCPIGDPSQLDPVYRIANQCFALGERATGADARWLATDGDTVGFVPGRPRDATPVFLKPSALGTYLLYDTEASYVVSDGETLDRASELVSALQLLDDTFVSPAEWEIFEPRRSDGGTLEAFFDAIAAFLLGTGPPIESYRLRHLDSGRWLGADGLVDDAADAAQVLLKRRLAGCAEFPEATVDARGRVETTHFPDGSLFGIVDTHSHILSNFGFGGAGIFHGAPFHRLGVEHALMDCSQFHGEEGRRDIFGFGFDNQSAGLEALVPALLNGETLEPNHATEGWPEFTDWPSTWDSSTHQTQYYRWLERAWLGGLRLVVQHAVNNQIICDLTVGLGSQPQRYSCNDMVGVDRSLDEIYAMQDYIDAQEGGPGMGWFRIVTSPQQAREVIAEGKLAVILGIETSNLFDCFLTPPGGGERCTEQDVIDALDEYQARGVRALFPVHKYDNGFSAGDGDKFIIELGNVINTGHFLNFTTEGCPDVQRGFDGGPSAFRNLIMLRDEYLAPAPLDFSGFAADPLASLFGNLDLLDIVAGGTEEEVCQATGLTELGEFLILEMMKRGMILEVDHLPRFAYVRAFELLEANDYPAVGTHGRNNDGRIYALGGVSKSGFSRCRRAGRTSTVDDGYQARIDLILANDGFPAEGFGFDFNGFAGGPRPRFGPDARCGDPQEDPVTYPFTAYGGDVTFDPPWLGSRPVDFNTEGVAHIGLLPELIEDVRGDGVTDEDLEPLFKSAEGYLRMWEKAEARGAVLAGGIDASTFRMHEFEMTRATAPE